MSSSALFSSDPPVAARQPKTDRLVLSRLLHGEARSNLLKEGDLRKAHDALVKWSELESSGQLLRETQMQGTFLDQIFGKALGYRRSSMCSELCICGRASCMRAEKLSLSPVDD
jgi:hypothetical protein